ncbi:MAG TPA: hypothetical protein VGG84_13315 [Gemmatimonadaceae bacterium]|jgi:lipopolysaccharide export system protein LptC
MAEIPIQRKERSRLWPLLLLLLIVVAIVAWYVWSHHSGTAVATGADSTMTRTSNGALSTDTTGARARGTAPVSDTVPPR